jgi:hypothetical protein
MVIFLVELMHPDLNLKFDVSVIYLWLIILSMVCDVSVDSKMLFTDFINLKIKSVQSLRSVHRGRLCLHIFIGICTYMYMSICIYTV